MSIAGSDLPSVGSRRDLSPHEDRDKPDERALGDVGVSPVATATVLTQIFSQSSFGELPFEGLFTAISDCTDRAAKGDLADQRAMLASQSMTLNAMFCALARRAAENADEYPRATELYMRLALKAQAQSRATVEALDRLVNGREQIVRHVHVDNRGGQAIVAENIHAGGPQNGKDDEQPHTIPSGREQRSTSLRREDTEWQRVPVEGDG